MSYNVITIIKKELYRVFTDKRLVFSAFILPAISIALIYSVMGTMVENMSKDIQEHIPVVYVQNPPQKFKDLLNEVLKSKAMDLNIISSEEDIGPIKEEIKNGKIDLLITFSSEFEKQLEEYRYISEVPEIKTYYNSNEEYSSETRFDLFNNIFNQYEELILGDRLGDIKYVNVFDIDRENIDADVADKRKAAGKGLGMILPMLVSTFLFAGAMGIGIDMIAGEKERGTMATMLVTPVKRETIAIGKIISLGIIALVSTVSSFIGILLSMPFSGKILIGNGEDMNLTFLSFGILEYTKFILIMISLVSIYVGLICLISIIANTVKEAGTYIAPIYMLVILTGFLNMFTTKAPKLWHYFIPIYGGVAGMRSLLLLELTWGHVLIILVSSTIVTGILIEIIRRMFNSEKIMFKS
ncbi:ABC transporter permease [Defluviitalea phaphyphila]|uniref:ABC transporter permease n=1 Tax=Defluviitalea phaphyphila TaxID=1473580 RepID=UPI000730B998|nr:ABC transporter permease [Defluviitalea phaphyphila]